MPMIRRPGATPGSPQSSGPVGEEGAPTGGVSGPSLHVPSDTTPTWELEMLVSGAVLVGLVQVAPLIDHAWQTLVPRLGTRTASMEAGLAYALLKGALYALLATFVVHLLSRAYWVALVGLDSVFPRGIRWETVRESRGLTAEEKRQLVRPLPTVIAALDNFCSVVFAVGFLAVAFTVTPLVLVAAAAAGVWLLSATLLQGYRISAIQVIVGAWLVVLLPRLLHIVLARVAPESRLARALRRLNRYGYGALVLRLFGSLAYTLMTNIRRRRVMAMVVALLAGSVGLAFSQMTAARSGGEPVLYPGVPGGLTGAAAEYRYYADQRLGSDAFVALPFIQSDVVKDPYIRLFIPYVPRRDAGELQACRAQALRARAAASAGARLPDSVAAAKAARRQEAAEAVDCLARIHAVTVNGRSPSGLSYRFYTDAGSGLQGILLYISVSDLPRGRNVLVVRRPTAADEENPAAGSYTIPFWL